MIISNFAQALATFVHNEFTQIWIFRVFVATLDDDILIIKVRTEEVEFGI